MKIVSAKIYQLQIPFIDAFTHSLHQRSHSDSVIVKLTTDSGIFGYGEGAPRKYVTGESLPEAARHIKENILPLIMNNCYESIATSDLVVHFNSLIPNSSGGEPIRWNASRAAVEIAFLDCILKARKAALNTVLPGNVTEVEYSGVISSESLQKTRAIAMRLREAGFRHIKLKVTGHSDIERVQVVRDVVGPDVSLRLDANCAFTTESARRFLSCVEKFDIACVEQPLPRGAPQELAALKLSSSIPIMADESIITIQDAEELINHKAVDLFNLRISKCGGIHNTLAIAKLAQAAGIGLQLGCQVGETAILSATGRQFAAHMGNGLQFVEGSYGTLLLTEDVSKKDITFGYGGKALVLNKPGIGVEICEQVIERYSREIITV